MLKSTADTSSHVNNKQRTSMLLLYVRSIRLICSVHTRGLPNAYNRKQNCYRPNPVHENFVSKFASESAHETRKCNAKSLEATKWMSEVQDELVHATFTKLHRHQTT